MECMYSKGRERETMTQTHRVTADELTDMQIYSGTQGDIPLAVVRRQQEI